MFRWLTPYRLGGLAIVVILGILHGDWMHTLNELGWTIVLPVLWFALRSLARDLWRDWFLPEIRAASAAELEEGGGLEPPRDCSPTP